MSRVLATLTTCVRRWLRVADAPRTVPVVSVQRVHWHGPPDQYLGYIIVLADGFVVPYTTLITSVDWRVAPQNALSVEATCAMLREGLASATLEWTFQMREDRDDYWTVYGDAYPRPHRGPNASRLSVVLGGNGALPRDVADDPLGVMAHFLTACDFRNARYFDQTAPPADGRKRSAITPLPRDMERS